jgi:hypothetical protein
LTEIDFDILYAKWPNLLRPAQVARELQITTKTIYAWYPDKLKGTSINGIIRIYKVSMIQMLKSGDGKKNDAEIDEELEAQMNMGKNPKTVPKVRDSWAKKW